MVWQQRNNLYKGEIKGIIKFYLTNNKQSVVLVAWGRELGIQKWNCGRKS